MINKYQKALSFFFKIATPRYLKVNTNNFNKKYSDNLFILSSLIAKATPIKPKLPTDDFREIWNCPNCNAVEIDYHQYNYCPSCGQAIDWSDEND